MDKIDGREVNLCIMAIIESVQIYKNNEIIRESVDSFFLLDCTWMMNCKWFKKREHRYNFDLKKMKS